MNRDTARLIILFLVTINIIAALWRFGGLWQSENLPGGNSEKVSSAISHNRSASESGELQPDEFKQINEEAFFRTAEPVDTALGNGHIEYCAQYVNITWPNAINGEISLSALHHALIEALYGESTDNIYLALEDNLHTAHFNCGKASAEPIKRLPDDAPKHHTMRSRHQLKVFLNSDRLIEFEIRKYTDNGSGNASAINDTHHYISFDKLRSRVLRLSDVVTDPNAVRIMVNSEIDRRNRHGENLKQATRLPDFRIERNRILFIFPSHEIGYSTTNDVAIALSYDQLGEYLTTDFRDIITNNGNYRLASKK